MKVALLVLSLTVCSACAEQAIAADTNGAPVAERSLYVEQPNDESGKHMDSDVLGSLHDALESELGKSHRLTGKPDAQAVVHVEITEFHMRNQASRWMLGAMSGKDFIRSKVSLVEPGSGATLLSVEVATSTANQWRGQDSIARLHAHEIANTLAQKPNQANKS